MKQQEICAFIDRLSVNDCKVVLEEVKTKLQNFNNTKEFITTHNPKLRLTKPYYDEYLEWCEENDVTPIGKNVLNKQVCIEWECVMGTIYDRITQRVGYGFKPY